ncbi:MAG TPA: type I-E CRISPR-associated protein Cas7/Cse4/CasC [Methanoregula sp.]|nr:type I-E CRISPR-associated protein Cas7/Cse4/CasC [Methanoregula sp.]
MAEFIQLHMLVSYPPSNLNRDDLGRPKTAVMGGTQRLRISSQSLKRAWRTSDIFTEHLKDHMGIRTREMGVMVKDALTSGLPLRELLDGKKTDDPKNVTGIPEEKAKSWAWKITSVFVDKSPKDTRKKTKKDKAVEPDGETKDTKKGKSNVDKATLRSEQLVFYSNDEIAAIQTLIMTLIKEKREPNGDELSGLLQEKLSSIDVAMFGRMLANATRYNVEAAVQVAHAVTVHEVAVEDDYFTAVDDLNRGDDDAGAGHIGELAFASGLFYEYVCINKTLLEENLGGDKKNGGKGLAAAAIRVLVESAVKVTPSGRQNSFASRAYASYLLVEKGTQQPRSLSVAYLEALNGKNLLGAAITALADTRKKMDDVYGKCWTQEYEMNAFAGTGKLSELLTFVAG